MIFKVLVDMKSCHGGEGVWVPGEWRTPTSPRCCQAGYHLTSDPLAWWKPKATLWVAEGRGAIDGDGKDKAAFAEARITEQITRDWSLLVMFPRLRAFLAATARSEDASADIGWANLSLANLSGANLSGANLSGANLSLANLSGANLSWANLWGANLSGANLSLANLWGANLSLANLSGADLSEADLSEADLSGADLSEADLSGANLSGAYRPTNPPPGWSVGADGRLSRNAEGAR